MSEVAKLQSGEVAKVKAPRNAGRLTKVQLNTVTRFHLVIDEMVKKLPSSEEILATPVGSDLRQLLDDLCDARNALGRLERQQRAMIRRPGDRRSLKIAGGGK